jgi:hypothetical protein
MSIKRSGEIADADGAQTAGAVGILHGAPRAVYVTVRLVNQVQVEIVELQAAQRLLDCPACSLVAGVLHP